MDDPHSDPRDELYGEFRSGLDDETQGYTNGHGGHEQSQPQGLPYVDITAPLQERAWLVHERIPLENVTLLTGDGAIGKSLLLMQLAAAVVLGRDWIGTLPIQGTVIYLSCEEDDREICRRLEDIAKHYGVTRVALAENGLHVISLAGCNAVLATFQQGLLKSTAVFTQLQADVRFDQPKLIVIDTTADTFAGNEIDRAQVRQFITMMRGLALEVGAALILAAHPSLAGKANESGISGSTAWHNSVRARMYFKQLNDETNHRVLEVKKNNYGPVSETITLEWKDGVYKPVTTEPFKKQQKAEDDIDYMFLKILRSLTARGWKISPLPSKTYAPTVFASQPEAQKKKITSKAFVAAMERLLEARKIKIDTEGPPSKLRSILIEIPPEGALEL